MGKIVVFGSFVNDLVATVDEFPKAGESVIGKDLKSYPGGKGLNQCVTVARLGGDVEMIGMIGSDQYGKMFLDLLKKENIKHKNVFVSQKSLTGLSQVQINKNGENKICVLLGANLDLDESYLPRIKKSIDTASLVIFQFEMREDITFGLIKYCNSKGKIVLVNPAPAHEIPDDILKCIDYLTPNETELAKIACLEKVETQDEIKNGCQKLLERGAKNIIVTLGEKGCYLHNDNVSCLCPGFKVKAIDTVAAGDSFNGALAVKIAENCSIEKAIMYANGMGALTVQEKGAVPSLKYRQDLEAFIKMNVI